MGAIIGTIVSIVYAAVQSVIIAVVGSALQGASLVLVTKLLTAAVFLVVTGAILQVVGKLLGIEKITTGIAKVLYMIAIVIIAIAAYIAQSIVLGLLFFGAAFVFLYLVDAVFGTNASKTFADAAVDIVQAVVDVALDIIDKGLDIIGTSIKSLFGGSFLTYLLLGAAGFVGYKLLTRDKPTEVKVNVPAQKLGSDVGGRVYA